MNYRTNFKGQLKKTFVLSRFMSSCFGMQIINNKVFLGVPNELFSMFFHVRWLGVHAIKGKSGIYLLFETGTRPDTHTCAIKLNMRNRRVQALLEYKKIKLVEMTDTFGFPELSRYNSFDMVIEEIEELDWEKDGRLTSS